MAEGDLGDCPIQLQAKQSARGSPSHITNTVVCVVKGENELENCDCVTAEYFVKDRGGKNEAKLALFLLFKWLSGPVLKYIKSNTMWFEKHPNCSVQFATLSLSTVYN